MHPIFDSVKYKWAEQKAAELYKLLRKVFPDSQKKNVDILIKCREYNFFFLLNYMCLTTS